MLGNKKGRNLSNRLSPCKRLPEDQGLDQLSKAITQPWKKTYMLAIVG